MFKFLSGLTTTVEVEENEIYVKIYVKPWNLYILSECFDYELQLKPYAYVYQQFKKEKRLLKEEEAEELAKKLNKDKTQFHQLDLDNQKMFPPFIPLQEDKTDKHRRYLENDDFHTCIEDDEFDFNGGWDFDSSSSSSEGDYNDNHDFYDEDQQEDMHLENEYNPEIEMHHKRKEHQEIELKEIVIEENKEKERLLKEETPIEDNKQGEKKEEEKSEDKKDDKICRQNCGIFRNIDKLRLVESAMDELANINLIKKHPDYYDSFYLRNYMPYQKRMTIK